MKKMPHRVRLVLFGILLFVVVVGYEYFGNKQLDTAPQEQSAELDAPKPPAMAGKTDAKPVEVYAVKRESLYDKVEALGTAQANESVDISSTVTELIKEIHFEDGAYALKNDPLVILEQREEQAQLKAAEAQLKEHQRELARLQRLLKNKATSKRTVEERETLVEISEQTIAEIKARIADRTIIAPFDGVLGIRQVSVGTLVNSGETITTIDDIHRIKLDFYVPSIFLPQLKPGNIIQAQVEALNDQIFAGKIDTINTRIDPVTRSVLVRAILPNHDLLLKPGLLMKINLIRNEREALVVPEESLIQRKDRFYVLVATAENTLEEREVKTGTHYPAKMEIVSGLDEGEKIVVRGIHTARPGQAITITKEWDRIRAPITGGL